MQAFDVHDSNYALQIRGALARHHEELEHLLASPASAGLVLGRRRSQLMDGLLVPLYTRASASVRGSMMGPPPPLVAVGGYGREILGLGSDLDVRFLVEDAPRSMFIPSRRSIGFEPSCAASWRGLLRRRSRSGAGRCTPRRAERPRPFRRGRSRLPCSDGLCRKATPGAAK